MRTAPPRSLRRRVRSEGAHRGLEQREGLDFGVAALMVRPGALDDDDDLLGRMDVNELAEGTGGQEGAGVDAGRPVRQRPPLVAIPPGAAPPRGCPASAG